MFRVRGITFFCRPPRPMLQTLNLRFQRKHDYFCGSQRSYVSEELRNALHLETLRKDTIVIKTFGNEKSVAKELDVVGLKIVCPGKTVVVEALCVPLICSDLLHQYTRDVSATYGHLKGLYLADYSTEEK